MSLNKAMLIGRLGRDPETKFTQSGKQVTMFSIATSDRHKINGEWVESTEWHNVKVWNKTAEVAAKYLKKGSQVYLEGKIETRSWEGKDGQKKYKTEVIGYQLYMLDSKGTAAPESGDEIIDSDSIPF